MANSKKPGIEEIKELIAAGEVKNQPVNAQFARDEKFYEQNYKELLNLPRAFEKEGVVLPVGRDMADAFVDNIDVANARVFVTRKGDSKAAEDEAEMMKKFYLGLLYRTNVEASISPWRVAAKHFALHGLAIMKDVWDADRWPDKPLEREGESEEDYAVRLDLWRHETHLSIPIMIEAVNPANIILDPMTGGKQYVIETHSWTRYGVERLWPHWKNLLGKESNASVEYVSYWDKDWRCDLVDGEPVLRIKGGVVNHRYGFIPYVPIESGLGNLSRDALPEMRYIGILRYIFDMLVSESVNYSMANILIKRETMKGGIITGADAASIGEIDQGYGNYTNWGAKDIKITDWTVKMPPQEVYAHLALTHEYVAGHAAPNSVRGLGESGVRSGADRRLVIAQATTKYQYSTEAFKHGAAKVLTNCALLQKNVIPGDIRVWARTPTDEFDDVIDKKKMKEPFTCFIEFAPVSEEDEYRRHDDLMRLTQTGIVTRKWARGKMSNVDPAAMEMEEEKERLKLSPSLNALVDQYAAGKLAAAISKRQMAEGIQEMPMGGQEMPMEGQPPPVGGIPSEGLGRQLVPPIPNRAQPGSVEEMINQRMAEMGRPRMSPGQGMGGGGNRP